MRKRKKKVNIETAKKAIEAVEKKRFLVCHLLGNRVLEIRKPSVSDLNPSPTRRKVYSSVELYNLIEVYNPIMITVNEQKQDISFHKDSIQKLFDDNSELY